jgi:two-component system nitrate/nitrite sensor histidine kinase NarX
MTWGLSDTYIQALRRRVEAGIPADRCRGCVPLTARVTGDCPLFQGLQAQARADGMASLVCLPITRDQERMGVIGAYFASPDGLPEAQLRLLNIVATEIAAALEGVRLRAREMAALSMVGQAAQRNADLDAFLGQVLEAALTGWGIEVGAIFLYEAAGGTWHSRVQRGLGDDLADSGFGLAVRLSEEARASGRPIFLPQGQPVGDRAFASAVAVPLLAEEEILGTLFLASTRSQALQPRQVPFITLLAHQTALAVRNAQLHLQLGHLAMLEERYRLSREMHDGLAQTLSYLGWQMDHLEMLLRNGRLESLTTELAEARRTVREAYLDVREAIEGLRMAVDHPGGLPAALREYLADFHTRTSIAAELEMQSDGPALAPIAELQLLRIAQEALTNVRKHSGAQHVRVLLSQEGDDCELTIADDGRGFDPMLPRSHHHLGLATMRERAQSLGGNLTIATGPGQGTRITATVPAPGAALSPALPVPPGLTG